jgi:hypothetical protein
VAESDGLTCPSLPVRHHRGHIYDLRRGRTSTGGGCPPLTCFIGMGAAARGSSDTFSQRATLNGLQFGRFPGGGGSNRH